MKKIVVLGAGMVGRAIARDLANQFSVTSVDINEENLALLKPFGIQTEVANLTNPPEIENAIGKADLVVSAVPGFMGKNTIEVVLENSKNVVDISFFPEDSAYLHEMAMEYGVTAFIDFGVAPGLSNLWFGNQYSKGGVKFLECMVGGLPVERKLPFQYKAPFSPIDVIEEYTRPARVKEGGNIVVREAMSGSELVHFPGIGTLEAFYTDGLRSLLDTIPIGDMRELTLRYPGHIDLIKMLMSAGFFSEEALEIKGQKVPPVDGKNKSKSLSGLSGRSEKVRPIDVTTKLLFKEWELKPGDEEFTIMRLRSVREINGEEVEFTQTLLDRYDPVSGLSSMSRTTGYTCTAGVSLIINGLFNEPGCFTPELIGMREECYQHVLSHLEARGIKFS